MIVVINNIHGLNHIHVPQRHTHTKLCGNLPLILLFRLSLPSWPKFLDRVQSSASLGASLDQTHSTARTTAENLAPFTIFFRESSVGGFVERWVSQRDDRMGHTGVFRGVLGSGVTGRIRGSHSGTTSSGSGAFGTSHLQRLGPTRSRAARRTLHRSVSLFPFLLVLLVTMSKE